MPPAERLTEVKPLEEEQDPLFKEITSIVIEDDLNEEERRNTIAGIELMLANFRNHLNGELHFGFIRKGEVIEERLERQVMPYPRIHIGKRPEVVDILRRDVEKKIASDEKMEK